MMLLVLVLLSAVSAQNLPLPPLPFAYNALEPFLSEQALRVHHLGHHQTYTDKLNVALNELRGNDTTKYLAKLGIDKLLQRLDEVPESLRTSIRNNGGGYVNHDFFWQSLSPPIDSPNLRRPFGPLLDAITASFDSFEMFVAAFSQTSMQLFGSGYTWLVQDTKNDKLVIVNTPNQDLPPPAYIPILVLDLWEHSYYLQHQNKRADFVSSFWKIVNWSQAQQRYAAAKGLPLESSDL